MEIQKLNYVFYSATNTTKKIVNTIASAIPAQQKEKYDLTDVELVRSFQMHANDLLVVGIPSYSGRVPQFIIESINRFKGDNTPAVILCTYGNRDYEDTLLELRDLVSYNRFKVISAAAFSTQHAIFPLLGLGRPNADDLAQAKQFALNSIKLLKDYDKIAQNKEIQLTGKYPYRDISSIPLHPTANASCNECGTCAQLCPRQAIDPHTPRKTDKKLCVSCARCIVNCPQKARAFRGIKYKIASHQFVKKYSAPKENQMIYL